MTTEERRLMIKVAKLYYLEGWTQNQICKKVGKSRPIISRWLKQAREERIVEIYIKDESLHTVELELILENKYDLNEVTVIATNKNNQEMVMRHLGRTAATYLSSKIDDIKSIGISWGKSVHALVDAFTYQNKPHIHVIPLIGGLGQNNVHLHSNHLTFQMAQKLDTSSSYLYAPAMVETVSLRNNIMESKDVSEVLNQGKNVDLAIVGVGNPLESTMTEMGYLNDKDRLSLEESNVIGDINSNFYDREGMELEHQINDRIIGLDLKDLAIIPEVMTIVSGVHKIEALHVALKKQYITTLFIDDVTATALIESY
ncbi:sugar-binding transcriptional regulator [Oceanobacillus chungangensis]|nr:sugar-binding transcriptional regulator [Oceanobacillus chungangensis]